MCSDCFLSIQNDLKWFINLFIVIEITMLMISLHPKNSFKKHAGWEHIEDIVEIYCNLKDFELKFGILLDNKI